MKNIVNKTLVATAMALTFATGVTMVSSPAAAHMHKSGSYTDSYSYTHIHTQGHHVVAHAAPKSSESPHVPKSYVFTGGYAFVGNYALCYPEPNSPAYRGCTYVGHGPASAPTTGHLAPAFPYTTGYQPYGYQYSGYGTQPYATSYGVYGY